MQSNVKKERNIAPVTVAYYRGTGENAAVQAWDVILEWAKKNHLNWRDHKFYTYNSGSRRCKIPWHEVMITIDDAQDVIFDQVKKKVFAGGKYISMKSDRAGLPAAWREMERWSEITKTKMAKHQWIEEWSLENWNFPEKDIHVLYPVE